MEETKDNRRRLSEQALFRVAVVLGIVIALFLLARNSAIPNSFGQYGNYRGDDVDEWASMEVKYVNGASQCSKCHQQAVVNATSGTHQGLDCQSCHGPAAKHLSTPKEAVLKIADIKDLCSSCHKAIAARPDKEVSMVVPGVHSGGLSCTRCHEPHQPNKIGGRKP